MARCSFKVRVMKKSDISIGLLNPKSPENVASAMRAAGNYQVNRVFYTGTRYARALGYREGAVNMSRKVSEGIPLSATDCLIDKIPEGVQLVCVEFAEGAASLPEFQHPEHAFYIFGPEDGSISQEIIDHADAVVYIPTVGCMNLAATVNVLLYDRLAKSSAYVAGNNLICASRDRNNTLKVR